MKRIKARVTKSDVVLIDIGFAGGKTFWIKMSWMFCSDGNDIRRADSIENAFQIQFSCLLTFFQKVVVFILVLF